MLSFEDDTPALTPTLGLQMVRPTPQPAAPAPAPSAPPPAAGTTNYPPLESPAR